MTKLIEKNMEQITTLCRRYKVRSLSVFGSILTPRFNQNSDVDLVVDFEDVAPADYADNYFSFKHELEDLFERPVDLVERPAIRNSVFLNNINRTKQLIFG